MRFVSVAKMVAQVLRKSFSVLEATHSLDDEKLPLLVKGQQCRQGQMLKCFQFQDQLNHIPAHFGSLLGARQVPGCAWQFQCHHPPQDCVARCRSRVLKEASCRQLHPSMLCWDRQNAYVALAWQPVCDIVAQLPSGRSHGSSRFGLFS